MQKAFHMNYLVSLCNNPGTFVILSLVKTILYDDTRTYLHVSTFILPWLWGGVFQKPQDV